MRQLRIVAMIVVFAVPVSLLAGGTECGDKADKELFAAQTWVSMAEWWHRYPHCDDGYFGEHLSETFAQWLSQERPAYLRLQKAVATHPEFRLLVAWHMDEIVGEERLRAIARNADRQCPEKATAVCILVRVAALKALSEIRQGR
jgi:hypothetical protein